MDALTLRTQRAGHPCGAGLAKIGHALALLILGAALSAAGLALGVSAVRARRAGAMAATIEVVVTPGDTLWSIARRHASEEADLRAVVEDILRLNGLEDARIRPGQVLLVEAPVDRVDTAALKMARAGR